MDELIRFAGEHVAIKNYRNGFQVASQVAASGEGDCTEHAVLLTALARATGRPARVAIGLLVAVHDGRVYAFGHAWTEIYDGKAWQIADATQPAAIIPGARLYYAPLLGLANEGPGYAMQLMTLAVMQPSRVVPKPANPNS